MAEVRCKVCPVLADPPDGTWRRCEVCEVMYSLVVMSGCRSVVMVCCSMLESRLASTARGTRPGPGVAEYSTHDSV